MTRLTSVRLASDTTRLEPVAGLRTRYSNYNYQIACGIKGLPACYYLFCFMKMWRCQVTCEKYESSETEPVMIADNFWRSEQRGNMWSYRTEPNIWYIHPYPPLSSVHSPCPSYKINPQTNYNQLLAMTISSVFSISHFNSAATETPQMPESWQNSH